MGTKWRRHMAILNAIKRGNTKYYMFKKKRYPIPSAYLNNTYEAPKSWE